MDDLVAIAKVVRPRGIKGEVVADILTDFPRRFEGLEKALAVLRNGQQLVLTIDEHWLQNGRLVFKFAGYDSIEAAENLRDAEICVAESEAVALEGGEYFNWQLEGCTVKTVDGDIVGIVRELQRTGGTDNLLVDGDGKDHLIPFAESICVDVDVENKLIRIDPPEGLLEL